MANIINAITTGAGGLSTTADASGSIQIATNNGTTAMTIDTSQNVGIGTTPSSSQWSGTKALQLGATAYISGRTSSASGVINISNNAFLNSTPAWQYITTNGCAIYEQSNDVHIWNNALSGTAGTTFTPTERMRIDSAGRLLVGTTNASITAGVGVKIGLSTATEGDVSVVGAATNNANDTYHLYSTGAGAFRFYVEYGGQIRATVTSIAAISDASLKENIRDLETGLSEVMALRPRRFDWIEETKLGTKDIAGFIAQEVEPIMPDLVSESKYSLEETKKSVRMGDMIPTLVKAIQEQQTIINDLKARITALEGAK